MPTLATQRLLLRQMKLSDAELLYKLTRDETILQLTHAPQKYSVAQACVDIEEYHKKEKLGKELHFAIVRKSDAAFMGMVSLVKISKANKRASICYWLGKQYRGNGYTKEAAQLLINYAFSTVKLNRIELGCSPANRASQKIIESLGAVFEGVARNYDYYIGIFHDRRVYSILRNEWGKKR